MNRASPKQRLRRLLALLALTVLLPSIALLWLLGRSINIERTALEQRFRQFCQDQLTQGVERWENHWRRAERHWVEAGSYREMIEDPLFASAILLETPSGDVRFPKLAERPAESMGEDFHTLWPQARWLEFRDEGYEAAAKLYQTIEEQSRREEERRRAWLGAFRCLTKMGKIEEAIAAWEADAEIHDDEALWIAALHLVQQTPKEAVLIGERLRDWVTNEDGLAGTLPLRRRLFIMRTLNAAGLPCATEPAEALLLGLAPNRLADAVNTLTLTRIDAGLWKMLASDRQSVVLIKEETLRNIVRGERSGETFSIALTPPDDASAEAYVRQRLSGPLAQWELALTLGPHANPFLRSSRQDTRLLRWIAWLSVAAAMIVAIGLSRAILQEARLNRLKNDFLAAVSHELKTPVTAIGLLVDNLLHKEKPNTAETQDYLALIGKENDRLSRLIDNFLSFSRMERHKYHFNRETICLSEIINEAVSLIKERHPKEAKRILVETGGIELYLEGDRDALVTVIVNLIDNAVKYSREEIQLRCDVDREAALITVSDQGIGMNESEQRQAFDKFYRANESLTNDSPGVGLGLSIVEFIVRAHAGQVSVESAPGKGSRFTIRLPIGLAAQA